MFNKRLTKEVNKFFGSPEKVPAELIPFLQSVSENYDQHESDKKMAEKIMELNPAELAELNEKLRMESEENKLAFCKIRESLLMLSGEENSPGREVFEFDDVKLLSIAELLKTQSRKRKEKESKLNQYLRDLEKTNKELDQFAYVVSHDLKAPLRAISSLSTWIEEDLGDNITPEVKENFATLKSRIIRMENLINGILEYSKAARTCNIEPVDTGLLVKEIVPILNCPDHIEIRIRKNFPVLQTEKIKLEQVFLNLIGNAIKYNDRKNGVIEIGCADFEDWCQYYVKDNGPGIDPQFHQKIFVIFQTLEMSNHMQSTGIGLAIVKKIVEEQGGKVWVESEPGNGAKFEFIWPKVKPLSDPC